MIEPAPSPLILVADDDDKSREKDIPKALGRLGARTIPAKDVLEACMAVAEHSGAERKLDLIVLDMHMPLHKPLDNGKTPELALDGGIQFLRSYRLVTCPVVVFTGYPSYKNCVLATQAGAAAYLPKLSHDTYEGPEGGINELVETCRRLLKTPGPQVAQLPPGGDWLTAHHDWLVSEYGGRWVAFVDLAKGRAAQLSGEEREGLMIVSEESKQDLERFIIGKLPLLKEIPTPLFVPEDS